MAFWYLHRLFLVQSEISTHYTRNSNKFTILQCNGKSNHNIIFKTFWLRIVSVLRKIYEIRNLVAFFRQRFDRNVSNRQKKISHLKIAHYTLLHTAQNYKNVFFVVFRKRKKCTGRWAVTLKVIYNILIIGNEVTQGRPYSARYNFPIPYKTSLSPTPLFPLRMF